MIVKIISCTYKCTFLAHTAHTISAVWLFSFDFIVAFVPTSIQPYFLFCTKVSRAKYHCFRYNVNNDCTLNCACIFFIPAVAST